MAHKVREEPTINATQVRLPPSLIAQIIPPPGDARSEAIHLELATLAMDALERLALSQAATAGAVLPRPVIGTVVAKGRQYAAEIAT